MPKVILASSSPRRKELLQRIIPDFEVIPASVEEVMTEASPEENAVELARAKAAEVAAAHRRALVIGGDTIVWIGNKILGKPANKDDALQMLKILSGKMHTVTTGLALLYGHYDDTGFVSTKVLFKELSDETIDAYIKTGEPMDKAGAYGIQGKGNNLIHSISGSWTNVVGLPMELLEEMLERWRANYSGSRFKGSRFKVKSDPE